MKYNYNRDSSRRAPYYPYSPGSSLPKRGAPAPSVGKWIGVMLLTAIPVVDIIAAFAWAFGPTVSKSLKNYGRAFLILLLAVIILAAAGVLIAIYVFDYDFLALIRQYFQA
jgi:hypothetical protein